jgi:glycine cleavage system H protein
LSEYPDGLLYASDGEWIRIEGAEGIVGITDFAQEQLGDVVYVELPELDATVVRDEPFGVIESVKAAVDLVAPVSGKVTAINELLADTPELVNSSPYGDGWMIRLELEEPGELEGLMDADGYRDSIAEEG